MVKQDINQAFDVLYLDDYNTKHIAIVDKIGFEALKERFTLLFVNPVKITD